MCPSHSNVSKCLHYQENPSSQWKVTMSESKCALLSTCKLLHFMQNRKVPLPSVLPPDLKERQFKKREREKTINVNVSKSCRRVYCSFMSFGGLSHIRVRDGYSSWGCGRGGRCMDPTLLTTIANSFCVLHNRCY